MKQNLDLRLRDIKRTRNLMILLGLFPLIAVLVIIAVSVLIDAVRGLYYCNYYYDYLFVIIGGLLEMGVVSLFLPFLFRKNEYMIRPSKIGFGIFIFGLLIFEALLVIFLEKVFGINLMLVIGVPISCIGAIIGYLIFMIKMKVDKTQKILHVGIYIIWLGMYLIENPTLSYIVQELGIIPLSFFVYPMLSSYFAVRWARMEKEKVSQISSAFNTETLEAEIEVELEK